MNRKGMQNIFVKRLSGLLCAWLFPFAALYAQVDTTTYHQLSGVEVLGKVRPSTTRESTPLQVMDKAGIERLGVQDLSEAVKRFSGVTVQDYGGIGGLKTVSVRSLGAKHTAVCYDGVTVTDAQSGQVDISRFSLDNVDMISLSIGQADDIFQTARMYASAGALSIKTAAPLFKEKSYNAYVKLIYHIAYSYTYNKEDAEDIVSEVFMKVMHSIHSYQENGKFKELSLIHI